MRGAHLCWGWCLGPTADSFQVEALESRARWGQREAGKGWEEAGGGEERRRRVTWRRVTRAPRRYGGSTSGKVPTRGSGAASPGCKGQPGASSGPSATVRLRGLPVNESGRVGESLLHPALALSSECEPHRKRPVGPGALPGSRLCGGNGAHGRHHLACCWRVGESSGSGQFSQEPTVAWAGEEAAGRGADGLARPASVGLARRAKPRTGRLPPQRRVLSQLCKWGPGSGCQQGDCPRPLLWPLVLSWLSLVHLGL